MKRIYETFTDEEHAELVKAKGELNWHDFIMLLPKMEDVHILIANHPELEAHDASEDFATEYYRWLRELKELILDE